MHLLADNSSDQSQYSYQLYQVYITHVYRLNVSAHAGHKALDCQKSQIGSSRCDYNNKDEEITQQSQQSDFY